MRESLTRKPENRKEMHVEDADKELVREMRPKSLTFIFISIKWTSDFSYNFTRLFCGFHSENPLPI